MRRISEVLAELASDTSDLPDDVRETITDATNESDDVDPVPWLGWEGVQVVV